MTEHDGSTVFECGEPAGAWDVEEDIQLAAVSDLPVLISGPAAMSREVACEIDRQSRSPQGAVEVVDCREQGALDALAFLTHREAYRGEVHRAKIVLLQEVHTLSSTDQLRLVRQLEAVRLCRTPVVRIVASTSVGLFDRVADHSFNERLYYMLNVIHLMIPPARSRHQPSASS